MIDVIRSDARTTRSCLSDSSISTAAPFFTIIKINAPGITAVDKERSACEQPVSLLAADEGESQHNSIRHHQQRMEHAGYDI